MSIYLAYKEDTGEFIGWYDDQLHRSIPTPNIQVTEEQYNAYYEIMTTQCQRAVVKNGVVTFETAAMELTWDEIRHRRDMRLAKTDWTQGRDVPEIVYSKYMSYRQALRDVPQNFPTPESVVWPNPADYGI